MEWFSLYVAPVLSVLAAGIAVLSFIRSSPGQISRRRQDATMRYLATVLMQINEGIRTVNFAAVHSIDIDSHVVDGLCTSASRVCDALDDAAKEGLWSDIVGKHKYAAELHSAFISALITAISNRDRNDWTKEHLVMGCIRTMHLCAAYLYRRDVDLAGALKSKIPT